MKINQEIRKNSSYPEQEPEYLTEFHAYTCKMKSSVSTSRTAQLWLMFMDMTAIVRMLMLMFMDMTSIVRMFI